MGGEIQTLTYICDSKAALSVINKSKRGNEYFNPHQAEIDVIREIQKIKDNNNNIQRTYRWVESHQDNENDDIEINNIADSLATEAHDNVLQGLQVAYPKQGFLKCKATIKINGHIVTKDLKTTITKALYTADMDKYMKKKFGWNDAVIAKVDWIALESALKSKQGLTLVTIYKMMFRWQHTNTVVQRNEKRAKHTSRCPVCDHQDDQFHYMKCSHELFAEARDFAWRRFCQTMKSYKS